MAKTKQQKQDIIKDLVAKLEDSKSVVVSTYTGVDVASMTDLRSQCRESEVEYLVVKKTLLNLALEKLGVEGLDAKNLEGSLGLALSYGDEVAGAKILKDFSKGNDKLQLLAGILEDKVLAQAEVTALAAIPSRIELLAKAVGSIKAPISGFVNVLQGNLRSLVQVLNAIKENK